MQWRSLKFDNGQFHYRKFSAHQMLWSVTSTYAFHLHFHDVLVVLQSRLFCVKFVDLTGQIQLIFAILSSQLHRMEVYW